MVSITLSVPGELKKEMDEHKEINWSAVAREAIKEKISMMNDFKRFKGKLKSVEIDPKIKKLYGH